MSELFTRYRPILLICAAAFLLRIIYRLASGSEEFWTNGYGFYYTVAQQIVNGQGATWILHGLWAVRRPPAYSLLLIPAVLMNHNYLWIVIPQALIGAGTAFCAFLIGRELFTDRAGLIAAAITAIYPYYLVHDTAMQETGLLTFMMAFSTWLLLRSRASCDARHWLASGASLGLSVMVRTTVTPFAFFAAAWLCLFGAGAPRRRLWRASVVLGCVTLMIGVWMARNAEILGKPVMNSDTGLVLWVAHNPATFDGYPAKSIDSTVPKAYALLSAAERKVLDSFGNDHLARDRWYMARGLAYLRQQSLGQILSEAGRKVWAGFSWTLNPEKPGLTQWIYFLSYTPVLLLGLAGMTMHWRSWRLHSLIHAQFLIFMSVAAVIWSHTSHRTPLDVYLIIFASAFLEKAALRYRPATPF